MESKKITHFMYVPFTGLGLYKGYRGERWLKSRIKIFKQFVLPSLLAQTNPDFIIWISWRPEERGNLYVEELKDHLESIRGLRSIFTYGGLCFWDDKYQDDIAAQRLMFSLLQTLPDLAEITKDSEYVYMTIQPSDDLYVFNAIETIQKELPNKIGQPLKVVGWREGYIISYNNKDIAEYNPNTNPPFYTILFPKEVFLDAKKHFDQTGPYKSHEYVVELMDYKILKGRGFCVGTHGENISTHFKHPFKGTEIIGEQKEDLLHRFGIYFTDVFTLKESIRKKILKRLPHKIQRKLRFWFGEKLYNKFYEFLRG